jgi:hypothetical protein
MNMRTKLNRLRILPVLATLTALVAAPVSFAQGGHGGGGGAGGGHAAAGGFHGGGGYHGAAGGGYRGGYAGGYRGGYGGYRGGYGYGYRGGYYGGHGWGPGWGYGLGVGLFVAALPWYYSTYWWGGVPYYYADNTYYVYNDSAGQYQSVAPPAGLQSDAPPAGAPPAGDPEAAGQIYMYPKSGQTPEQQARDRADCDAWARQQTGTSAASHSPDYFRANAACLDARGYSVK